MLTFQKLQEMKPGTVIAKGVADEPRLCRMTIKWIAIVGESWDWAIYYHIEEKSDAFLLSNGSKCFTEEVIKDLVPCSAEAIEAYRF